MVSLEKMKNCHLQKEDNSAGAIGEKHFEELKTKEEKGGERISGLRQDLPMRGGLGREEERGPLKYKGYFPALHGALKKRKGGK